MSACNSQDLCPAPLHRHGCPRWEPFTSAPEDPRAADTNSRRSSLTPDSPIARSGVMYFWGIPIVVHEDTEVLVELRWSIHG